MENLANVTESNNVQKEEYGSSKVLGLDVQFSKMLGDVIIENYMKQLTEEDMKLIIDYMTKDLFDYKKNYNYDTGENEIVTKIIKEDWKERGTYRDEYHKSVGTQVKEMFNDRFKEELRSKIEEIIASDEYSKKIDDMAHEIIDYATEGYKEDLKNSIREKMIGNVMSNSQYYGNNNLIDVIHSVVQQYIPKPY